MVGGQRDLGGADQVQVVLLQVVDVVGGLAEEAGALHRGRTHQRRRDHRREAPLGRLRHGQVQQRDLQLRAGPGEEVEAGAGHLRPTLHVDRGQALGDLDVVLRLESLGGEVARGADGLEHVEVVLAAGRDAVDDQVRELLEQLLEAGSGLVHRDLGRLHLRRELLRPRQHGGLLVPLGPGHLLAEVLLLCAQGLEVDDRRAARLVRRDQLVDQFGRFAARRLGAPDSVGVGTQQLRVDHEPKAYRSHRIPRHGPRGARR